MSLYLFLFQEASLQLLELDVGGGAVLPTPPPITIPGNEAISTPPSSQPPGTIHSLPPWLNNVCELHPDYRKVVATVGRELGPRSFGLNFTYLLADVETGKLAAKDRPRETHGFKKNGGKIEKYFSTQAQVDELYPLLAPAAVVCRSKIKEGEFHVLIIAIDDACEDMRHASVLGEGLEAWAYRVKEVMGAVTSPGRAPTSKNALDGEVLSGFMVSALTRSSSNPTCVQNGQAWGPHVANKVVQTSLCSLTASLMEREATYIFWPNFGGSIGRMHQQLAGATLSLTVGSMGATGKAGTAGGYGNYWHRDTRDWRGYSWLDFFLLGDERAIRGGTFYFPELGLKFQPGKCSALYMETSEVMHATSTSWSEPAGAARYVATAIYVNKQALGASQAYAQKGEIDESFFLEPSAISDEDRKDPRIAAALELPCEIERC